MRKKTINKTEKTTKANGVSLTTRLARQQEISNREQRKLNALRDEEERLIKIPALQKLIGKCYKYRNSYGSGERWWLYKKVVGISGTMLKTLEFQITSYDEKGKAEIEESHCYGDMTGCVEITKDEWNAEWTKIAIRVSELAG
jgi:hypothetical protein